MSSNTNSEKTHIDFKGILALVLAFAIPLFTILLIQKYWIHTYYVPSASMENSLYVNDKVLGVDTFNNYKPTRSDIVVFEDTKGWLDKGPDGKNQFLVKRVIGLPGDTIECCTPEGLITVNGDAYAEPYITDGSNEPFPAQVVPEGHIFVLGDNRVASADSRYHIEEGTQFIDINDVEAKIFFTYWPLSHFGTEQSLISQTLK